MRNSARTKRCWVRVACASELPPGQVRRLEVQGRVLALFNLEGKFYAFHAVCPHQGGPLDQGTLWQGTLECPWHHHRYDPATGKNVYPANVYPEDLPERGEKLRSVQVFPVQVESGGVLVGLPDPVPG